MIEFPKMTRKEAWETDTVCFTTNKACPECGDKRRWFSSKSDSFVFCYTCIPQGDFLKPRDIKKKEKDSNSAKAKLQKENWCIPVVFGGYNTNK